MAPSQAAARRRAAQRRRRDVFVALLVGAVGSFLLAMIPGLSVLWSVQVLFDLLLVGYVALLIRIRNLAAERELKMRRLPQTQRAVRAGRAYDFGGAAYGGLDLHSVAN
jgi:hypothetical protein